MYGQNKKTFVPFGIIYPLSSTSRAVMWVTERGEIGTYRCSSCIKALVNGISLFLAIVGHSLGPENL